MNIVHLAYSYKRVAASATGVLVTGPCLLGGVFVPAVVTGQIVQIWDGNDATLASGTIVVGTCTLAANTFHEMPLEFQNGLVYQVLNDDCDLTFFYTPLSST